MIDKNEMDIRLKLERIDDLSSGPLDNVFLSKPISFLEPKEPICVDENIKVEEIVKLFQEHSCDCVFIVDREQKMLGIYTERDLVAKSMKDNNFIKMPVSKYMTKEVLSGKMDFTIAYVLSIMSNMGIKQFPIVDDNNYPIGIISLRNIVDYLVNESISSLLGVVIPKFKE